MDGGPVFGLLALADVDCFFLLVDSDLEFHVLDYGLAYFLPIIFEWGHTVGRDHDRVHLECVFFGFVGSNALLSGFYELLSVHC